MLPGLGYAFFQRPDVGQGGGVPGRLLLGPGPEAPFVKVVCCVCQGVKAALALALWDGVDVPQDVRDVIGSMGGQVEGPDAEGR